MVIPNSFPITQVNVTSSQDLNPPYAIVFARNNQNGFEWGAQCVVGSTAVANFPILQYGQPVPDVSYLQIYCGGGQYQIFWQPTGEGNGVAVMLEDVLSQNPYPHNLTNITPAGGLNSGDFVSVQLNINMNPAAGESGVTVTTA